MSEVLAAIAMVIVLATFVGVAFDACRRK